MTTLSNGVITLRPPTSADARDIAALVRASLPELEAWMPWATSRYDDAAARDWIANGGEYAFLIIDTDSTSSGSTSSGSTSSGSTSSGSTVVGICGLNAIDEMNKRANLGFWLHTAHTGRGLATMATMLLATHALEDLELLRLEVVMAVENHASRRVAERAGAVHEGILKNRLVLNGEVHDAHSFAITAGARPG